MANDGNEQFLLKAKQEIRQKIKTENKELEEINNETSELERAIKGYDKFYDDLNNFILESMQDFTVNEEDLPEYFKSNINEIYQNYVQIRKDAIDEIGSLNKYIEKTTRDINSNKRTLKFYRSQYMDSDFFDECMPLVDIYTKKIELYEKNLDLTKKIIKEIEKIADKLEGWK